MPYDSAISRSIDENLQVQQVAAQRQRLEQMGLVHTRHRSVQNAFVHIISCLVAYCFRKNKPKIKNAHQKYHIP